MHPLRPLRFRQSRHSTGIGTHSCLEALTCRHRDAERLPDDTKMPKCSLLNGLCLTHPRNRPKTKGPQCRSSLTTRAGSSPSRTPYLSETMLTPFAMTPSVTL